MTDFDSAITRVHTISKALFGKQAEFGLRWSGKTDDQAKKSGQEHLAWVAETSAGGEHFVAQGRTAEDALAGLYYAYLKKARQHYADARARVKNLEESVPELKQ